MTATEELRRLLDEADMVVQQNNRRDRNNDVQIYLGQDGIYHASPNCGRKVVDE